MQIDMRITQLNIKTTQVPVKVIKKAYISEVRQSALARHMNMRPFLCEMYEPKRKPDTSPSTKMIMIATMIPPEGPSAILSSKNP